MSDIVFVLGSQDCEMERAHELLVACDQNVYVALVADQGTGALRRVRPGEAATCAGLPNRDGGWTEVPLVGYDIRAIEVAGPWGPPAIDHHGAAERAGWGPERFLAASSLGQVIETLAQGDALPSAWAQVRDARHDGNVVGTLALITHNDPRAPSPCWAVLSYTGCPQWVAIPAELVFEAAADHCLAAGFAGACPGIDPTPGGAFWRRVVTTRRSVYAPNMGEAEFCEQIESALATLRAAPPAVALLPSPKEAEDPFTRGWSPIADSPLPNGTWIPGGGAIRPAKVDAGETQGRVAPQPGVLVLDGVGWRPPADVVKDLTHLPVDGPVAPNGDQFPAAFPFGPLASVMAGLGYVVRIRRRDGRLALRGGGCGLGTPAGTAPVEQWLAGAGVEVYGCEGADAPRPNNLYGDPARGLFGGTLREQA